MCQGVIVSLVKFKDKNNKQKRVVLKGIGSHSDLIKDNIASLKKRGWNENSRNQDVISIESDFSAWNKFTVENGSPTKSEMAILRRAYKECAGNAKLLIAHVKDIGRLDNSLVKLLSAQALAKYKEVEAPAWAKYEEVEAQAWAKYEEVKAQAWAKLFRKKENRVKRLQ